MRIEDGALWTPDTDAQISEDMLTAFATDAGQRALVYLRKVTFGRVLPPTATAEELRDLEGRRALVAIIDMRMQDGRERRKRTAEQRAGADEPGRSGGAGRKRGASARPHGRPRASTGTGPG